MTRADTLLEVLDEAKRGLQMRAEYIADAVVDGYEPSAGEVLRYRLARDCHRIDYAMWHMEVYGSFPRWWRETAPLDQAAGAVLP